MNTVIREVEAPFLKNDIPYFRPGDTITVSVRIVEGDKERIQDYTGVVIARRGGGLRETITVRRTSFGVGMERVFHLHSPRIEKIKIVRRGRVRRAKLYYLRNLSGKKARLTERRVDPGKLAAEAASADKALQDQIALGNNGAPAAEEATPETEATVEAAEATAEAAEAPAAVEEQQQQQEAAPEPVAEAAPEAAPEAEAPAAEEEKKES